MEGESSAVPNYTVVVESRPAMCGAEVLRAVLRDFLSVPRYYDREIFKEYVIRRRRSKKEWYAPSLVRICPSLPVRGTEFVFVEEVTKDMVLTLASDDGCLWKYSIEISGEELCVIKLEVVMFSISEEEENNNTVDPTPLQRHVDRLSSIATKVSFLCSAALGGVQDVLAFLGTREFTQICGVVANGFAMMDQALKNSPSYRVVLAGEPSVQMYFKCESDVADGDKSKEEGEKEAVELEGPPSSCELQEETTTSGDGCCDGIIKSASVGDTSPVTEDSHE
ncbi:hypothetical protein Pmar_PMAR011958 [Perkinsus marinus ATCC 50983]|uniref:Uncharacterized protein n=1 Tax=Perkinsus marinus (strain ATCC 50983 / TXsc) TaxID=423536 RepID=C5LBT1_PERM5|nr:hypothetical protein Pmar_PMAR011958 [Perkinsus marinus ATCC 50983]EER05902.1 hypothetical protein Pmar_PMAR011958 [Perkinsus marinus ATCC 50983]|eukprot:XP_002774086.1 hypothetical protein Pmar_PMAR011958 [Perkinsus marinus ATCC 50983]